MLLGFQFRILLILREMQTKSTPPLPLPFLEKNREIFFFQQNTSSFKIYPIRLCLQVQYVCKCYF